MPGGKSLTSRRLFSLCPHTEVICLWRPNADGGQSARRHCQVDVEQAGSAPDEAMTHSSASDAGHLSPDTAGPCSQEPMMDGPQEVAADTKEILNGPCTERNRCAWATDLNRRI